LPLAGRITVMKERKLLVTLFCLLAGLACVVTTQEEGGSADPAYQVVHGWPALPEGYALGQVVGVDVDSQNRVWVFHRAARPVLCIDGDTGEILSSFGDEMFQNEHGLAVDGDDNVWLTDADTHVVEKYSPEGELLMTLGIKGKAGEDEERFNKPTDVEVAPDGSIYVTDGYGNNRVVKLDSDGKFVTAWGAKGTGTGEFDTPHGIAIDGEGRVYIADRGNSRMQVFEADGTFLSEWRSDEIGRPWGVDITADGNVVVADGGDLTNTAYDRNGALLMTPDGEVIERWGSYGSQDGQFYWAHDIAAGDDGAVYVTDVNVGMRVQKFVRR
jgi:peptidylamidoglycolate lyase